MFGKNMGMIKHEDFRWLGKLSKAQWNPISATAGGFVHNKEV